MPGMSNIQPLDRQIVELLGKDARQSNAALARKLKVSTATVRRRLKKLTRNGLLRISALVDPAEFGMPLVAVISLDVTQDRMKSSLQFLVKRPEIRWVSATTGRFDIIALARFPNTEKLFDFLTNQLPNMEGVKDSETFLCYDVKKGSYVPLTEL